MGSGSRGHAIEADGGESLGFGGATLLIKAESDTASFWEELPPLLDTPLHIHKHEDEYFQILAGEHVFHCGDDEFEVGPGGFVFLPRGVPHAHRRSVKGEGRLLVMTVPGGFVGFFRMLAEADHEGRLGPEVYAAASERYGITWVS